MKDSYTKQEVRDLLKQAADYWIPKWDDYNEEPNDYDVDEEVNDFIRDIDDGGSL